MFTNTRKKDIFFILLILFLALLFFCEILFGSCLFAYRDFHRYFYPTRLFASSFIREGIIPLWNPYLYCGLPFLADLQSAIFYPFSLLTYLLPYHLGLKLFVVIQFILAGFFMYLFLRELRLSEAASFVGSITFIFSGYVLSTLDMLIYLSTLMWTPLVFLFFNMALNELSIIKFKWILLCAISLGLMFLGADPTGLYQTVWALLFFAIAKGIGSQPMLHGPRSPKSNFYCLLFTVYSLFLVCLIGLGLTLFQAIPFLEFISLSSRSGGLEYPEAVKWAFNPLELINFILPLVREDMISPLSYLGSYQAWLATPYLGIVPFLLILLAILFEGSRKALFFASIFLGSIILSFGDLLPGYHLLYKYLPFFSMMRYPVKFLFMATFSGAILAGIGFDYLLKGIILRRGLSGFLLKFIFYFNLLLILVWLLLLLNKEGIIVYLWRITFPEKIKALFEIDKWYFFILNNLASVLILSLITFLLLLLNRIGSLSQKLLVPSLIIIIIVDHFLSGINLSQNVDERLYQDIPDSLSCLLKDRGDFRIFLTPKTRMFFRRIRGETFSEALINVQKALVPNFCLPYHLFDFFGYTSLRVRDYEKLLELVSTSKFSSISHLLSMANVKYLITKWEINEEGLKLIYDQKGVKIYESLSVLPRAFLVPSAKLVENRGKILEAMLSKDFDPRKEVILEEGDPQMWVANADTPSSGIRRQKLEPTADCRLPTAEIVEHQPNKVITDISAPFDGFLFLSDTYYPGWKAYVDGEEARIYRANYTFRAISIKEGRHRVGFIYKPKGFIIGLIGTAFAILSLLIYAIVSWSLAKKRVHNADFI